MWGRADGLTDGQLNEGTGGWTNKQTFGCGDGRMDKQMDSQIWGQTDRQTDGHLDVGTGRWANRRTVGCGDG